MFGRARRFVAFVAPALVLLTSSCKQSEGDRCEIDDDCSTGLICTVPQGNDGRCINPNRPRDAGTDVATSVFLDSGTITPTDDASVRSDGAGPDAATPDAPVPDAPAPTDTASPDAAADASRG